jgi:putative Holliday junction resolvase
MTPEHSALRTPHSKLPSAGSLLGLDYGTRRIGLAISTPEQNLASPLENYTLRSDALDAKFLREVVADYRIVGLVVGLPVHMSGDEGEKAAEARAFAAWVSEVTGLPVAFWDERCTTAAAEDLLREAGLSRQQRKARLDKLAAQIMLQAYLDGRTRSAEQEGTAQAEAGE